MQTNKKKVNEIRLTIYPKHKLKKKKIFFFNSLKFYVFFNNGSMLPA